MIVVLRALSTLSTAAAATTATHQRRARHHHHHHMHPLTTHHSPNAPHRSSLVICSCASASDPMASISVNGKKRLSRNVAA